MYEEFLQAGYEGAMLKNPFGLYTWDRSKHGLKYKPFEVDEYRVVGWAEGDGRNAGRLGALVIEVQDGVTCNVGGGYSDELRNTIWATRDTMVGRTIRVKYKGKTEDKKLREPVFVAFA
jgi:DNA ligase-1